jgi:hypothetical protein
LGPAQIIPTIDAYFSFLISAFALLREEIDDDCKNINEMTG